jgi:lactate dehydrogenase-like 2-hydroxyacid dehydrogenase
MNSRPRLLVTRRMPPNVTNRLQRDYAATLNADDAVFSAAELRTHSHGHDALLVCASEKLDGAAIDGLPASVRVIATFSVGYEHIDVDAAARRGIVVTNTPDVLTDATADVALLCLLGAARRAHEGQSLVRQGRWHGWHTTMLLGTHVSGKTLGIVGMGRIGRAVAQRARGFNMQVHYYNRSRLAPEFELGAVYHERVETLLPLAHFLSLNAPSSPETARLLNAARLAALPDRAIIVNTARGDLVDDDALIAALTSGKVAAAGLDVFRGEPALDPRYRELDNVFLLPHLGSATHETRDLMGFRCLDNLDAFFGDRRCPDALAPVRGEGGR